MAFSNLLRQIPITRRQPHLLSFINLLSFTSPESAATSRRRHRHLLGMPPPSPLPDIPFPSPPKQSLPSSRKTLPVPSIPKLPDSSTSLSGPRLTLHNTILSLLRSGDLDESSLLLRHSVYSNSRPAIHTVNAVLSSLLAESRHTDLISLHRFVNQAGITPTIVTHNLIIQCYVDSRKLDVALSYYRFFSRQLPLLPSRSTYRILVKALVTDSRIEEAVDLKDEMAAVIELDPEVYGFLMSGLVDAGDPDRALVLYQELREKLGDSGNGCSCRAIYGSLMKAYFKKGMKEEALELYNSLLGEMEVDDSQFRFGPGSYNSVLDVLCRNGRFEEALSLFEKMMAGHCPPRRLSVDLESFGLMVDGYCASGRFEEAMNVFGKMGEKKVRADVLAYNSLIRNLGGNGMVEEAEELYRGMSVHGIKPNEHTFAFLMEACFVVDRMEDATRYLSEMADSGIEPGTLAYSTVLCGLVKKEKLEDAMVFFDRMIEKEVKRDLVSYEVLLKAFCESDRLDHAFKVARALLMDKSVVCTQHMKEILEAAARRGRMEEELVKLYDEVEKEKEDEVVREAEEKARLEALAREERLAKRAEAKAKQAATTKITKEHIEMHIKRFSLGNVGGEKQDLPSLGGGGGFWNGGGLLKQISDNNNNNSSSDEVLKVGINGEELKGVDGMGFKSTATV